MAQIAFIGLGTMGAPMALNLLKAGHSLRVYDQLAANLDAAQAAGATISATAAQAIEAAEIVITMLPTGQIVHSVLGGATGLFATAQGEKLFIDCSTIAPNDARALGQEAAAQGQGFVDAPVSGGVQGARDATLAIMAGGTAEAFARAEPILQRMARVVYHAGETGAGQSAKICNNMLAAVIMAGTAEALALGESLGLEMTTLSAIIGKSSGGSFLMERWNPVPGIVAEAPSSRGYNNGFQLQLMLKDLGLALDAARAGRRPVPMGALAQNLYALQLQSGAEAPVQDFSQIIDVFRTGLTA